MTDPLCTATNEITYAEHMRYADVEGAGVCVDIGPVRCDLRKHSSLTPHTALLQTQDNGAARRLHTWWLRWNGTGYREIVDRPECEQLEDESDPDKSLMCLLIRDHPGDHHFI